MINIKGIDKAELLVELYNHSHQQGLGELQPNKWINIEEARNMLRQTTYFDYIYGKVMKVDLSSDEEFDERLYDNDNGQGMAQSVVNGILKKKLEDVDYDYDKNEYELKNGRTYGIPINQIYERTIFLNNNDKENPWLFTEMSDPSWAPFETDEYIANNVRGRNLDKNKMDFCLTIRSLDLGDENDIILCKYNKKNNSFIEPITNIEFPFYYNYLQADEDGYGINREIDLDINEDFQNEYNNSVKNPLLIFNSGFYIYKYNPTLKRLATNEKYKERLQLLEQKAKLNLTKQFNRMIEIEHVIANYENNSIQASDNDIKRI